MEVAVEVALSLRHGVAGCQQSLMACPAFRPGGLSTFDGWIGHGEVCMRHEAWIHPCLIRADHERTAYCARCPAHLGLGSCK